MQGFSQFIREVPDFPKPGIVFKDITPLLGNPTAFHKVIDEFVRHYKYEAIDVITGIEARGFIFATAARVSTRCRFCPNPKKREITAETYETTYELEYGHDTVEIHKMRFRSTVES